jgi:hypothetical protein
MAATPIHALFTDKRLTEIRNMTAVKDDGVPFLLLPVRIETRFMELDEPSQILTTDSTDEILDRLLFVQVSLLDLTSANGVIISRVTNEVRQVNDLVEKLTNLSAKNKRILIEMAGSVQETLNLVISRLGAPAFSALSAEVAQLRAKTSALVVDPEGLLNPARALLDRVQEIFGLLDILSNRKKTPFQNVKNKKDLYEYIDNKLKTILEFYENQAETVSQVKFISKNQRDTIIRVHSQTISLPGLVPANLSAIHDDPAWQQFVNEKDPVLAKIVAGLQQFTNESITRLLAVPAPPQYDFSDLLHRSMKALIDIKRLSISKPVKYQEITKFKKQIRGSLGFIDKSVDAISNGAISVKQQAQLQKLGQIYGQIKPDLANARTSLNAFQAKNNSQKFGINTIGRFLDNDAATVLDRASAGLVHQQQKAHELWVRIYPDDIFIHTHEEALTEKEFESGRRFWNAWWVASGDLDIEKAAWKRLCSAHGTKRASWISSLIDPRKHETPLNTDRLKNKPFKSFAAVQDIAKTIPLFLQALQPKKEPVDFWTTVTVSQFNAVTTQIGKLKTTLDNMIRLPEFLVQKLDIQLIRSQGDLDAIASKISAHPNDPSLPTPEKRSAFDGVLSGFNSLLTRVNEINRSTIEEILDEFADEPFDYKTPELKQQAWETAPHTKVLPERFVVVTVKNEQFQHIVVGNKITRPLQMGMDPALFTEKDGSIYHIDAQGDLQIEENLRWMADYNKAIEVGMGITLPLTEQQYNAGFDKLLVLGVNDLDAAGGKQAVEKLLLNHTYAPDGMSMIKVGTPTNNTETATSGYSARDNDEDERFDIEILNNKFNESETDQKRKTDGKRLTDALGIDSSNAQKINHRNAKEVSNAYTMNRALWHATIGHTMEEMWDHVFTYDNIHRVENFFINHCIARGVIPSVRVGMQPYGILPTTAYSRYEAHKGVTPDNLPSLNAPFPFTGGVEQARQIRFDVRFHAILQLLSDEWTWLREHRVEHYGLLEAQSPPGSGTPQQRFIEILGLNPTSTEYHYRYGVNITRTGVYAGPEAQSSDIKGTHGSILMHGMFKEMMLPGKFAPSFDFLDEKLPGGFGAAFKLLAGKYSRIRDQFDQSRIFRNRFISGKEELRALEGYFIDKQPLSYTNRLEKIGDGTFIDWLLNSSLDKILAGNNPQRFPDPNPSVLFLLMRQSIMQAYQEGALEILQVEGLLPEDERRIIGDEKTYSEWHPGNKRKYNTKWHALMKDFEDLSGFVFDKFKNTNPFYNYLLGATGVAQGRAAMSAYITVPDTNPIFNGYVNHATHRKLLQKVDVVRDSFALLNELPTKDLSMLLAEHIDLCSHRLDAWINGLANRRLAEQRAVKNGIHLGAFGWVENLQRDPNKRVADTNEIPSGLSPTDALVYKDPDNDGFIHAPSLNHAITAAVLRGAYRAGSNEEDINNRLAVNLSSARVRAGLNLIDGVKNGLQIGAILGFQFEKGLHERYQSAELDQFILPFRNAFPLVVPVRDNAAVDKPPAYNSNVVDGMALLNKIYESIKWMDFPSRNTMYDVLVDPANAHALNWLRILVTTNGGNNTHYQQIAREIDRMADALDALGDIAISESVFQVVQGNHVRAAAMVSSLAQGKNIPDPQIVETPRSGTIVTQRVLLNLLAQPSFSKPKGWIAAASPRAQAEPSLNNWLGNLLGAAADIRCVVTYQEPDAPGSNFDITLEELGIQPIDFLFLSANETDFKQLISYHFRQKSPVASEKSSVTVDFRSRQNTWDTEVRTIAELSHFLKQLRIILLQTQVAGAEHLVTAGSPLNESNPGNHNITQLASRTQQSVNGLKKALEDLRDDVFLRDLLDAKILLEAPNDNFSEAQFKLIRAFLLTAIQHGISNASPAVIFEKATDLQAAATQLFQQLATAYKQLSERYQLALKNMEKLADAKFDYQRLSIHTETLRIIFGKVFPVIPLYQSDQQPLLATQLNLPSHTGLLRHAGALAMPEWLQSIARVRPRMNALEMIDLSLSSQNQSFEIKPVQLKYNAGDYWLGAEYPSEYTAVEDKLSVIMINPTTWQTAAVQVQAGLLLDEWIEIIPEKEETTGIVINYDQPDATPPQSLLLAVTPVQTGNWSWDDLLVTLIDTLEMAKNRAVEPDHLEQSPLSHILPAILSEVVPPQAASDGDANPLGVQVVMDFAFAQKITEDQ